MIYTFYRWLHDTGVEIMNPLTVRIFNAEYGMVHHTCSFWICVCPPSQLLME